jgi:8-oxo-dGTP diphosphatase
MARASVLAAGGIVLRREQPPRIAVVRLRKRDEWVLPKGKLDDGETPRTAARREVLEETGHDVTVHEFLGTLVYDSGGRSRVVHYWRMEADGAQVRALMRDIRAVEWLPLDAAVARLSRGYERVFLGNVGPIAVNMMARQWKEKAAAAAKRREATVTEPELPLAEPAPPASAAEQEIVVSPREAEPAAADALQAGDGEAMPPRQQRASFAERVRNWLGSGA